MVTPKEWRERGHYRQIAGQEIFVSVVGNGEPVLVLHGFPTSSYDFSRVAPLLQDRFKLILFDYPGFGFSSKPLDYPYSLFHYADIAEELLDQLGIRQCALFVHDIGDSVALELLRRGNFEFTKICLLNGSVFSIPMEDRIMLLLQKLSLSPVTGPWIGRLRLVQKPWFASTFAKLFAQRLPKKEMNAFWSLIKYNHGNRIYDKLMGYMQERREHQEDWLTALRHHSAPLTIIWGMADPVATPAVAEHLVSLRPDAKYIQLPNVGHYPQWEAPEAVVSAVRAALEEAGGG